MIRHACDMERKNMKFMKKILIYKMKNSFYYWSLINCLYKVMFSFFIQFMSQNEALAII